MKNYLFILLLCIQSFVYSQEDPNDNARLATAGRKSISKGIFTQRFEFTPQLGTSSRRDIKEAYLSFLYSLLSEKLWALDAEDKALDRTPAMISVTHLIENMFIRDLLYQKEIRGKITVTEEELERAVQREQTSLYVNYLFSADSTEIANLHQLLAAGIPFDTLLNEDPLAGNQRSPEKIVFGQMAEDVEDILYTLPLRGHSKPVKTPEGWFVFRLTNLSQEITISGSAKADQHKQNAEKILRARKEKQIYREYFINFLQNRKIEVNAVLLKNLAYHLESVLIKHTPVNDQGDINISLNDLNALIQSIPEDTLQKAFVSIDSLSYSYHDFILSVFYEGFRTQKTDINSIYGLLQIKTRKFLEMELLALEGRRMGLDLDPVVQNDVQSWRDNYLYQLNRNNYLDSFTVSDDEAREYYRRMIDKKEFPDQVNFIEILTDNMQTVDTILARVKSGEEFKRLAKEYNRRKWTQKTNGEYDFSPVFLWGELSKIAWSLDSGQVFGPIKMPDGYSVVQTIGKRKGYVEIPTKSFEELRDNIISELKNQRYRHFLNRYTVVLALRYGIDINADVFRSLESININSFIVRNLGFGGQVTAAPLIAPDNDWLDEYFKKKSIAP